MELRYYQYRLGTVKLIVDEMHASLHEIQFDDFNTSNPFIEQIFNCVTSETYSPIIKKHIQRGINIGDDKHTRLIAAPDFPIKEFEPSYYHSKKIDFGLSGGDVCFYKPDLLVESYYYFWETQHPFSQWHKCGFIINGSKFNCAEQYMMYGKAKLFSDVEVMEKILNSTNPREQKLLGRQVRGFDIDTWNSKAPEIVYRGNKEKFRQNGELYNLLLSTKGKTIVEASPDDSIWGNGLTEHQEESESLLTWRGTNWLGIILTELREEFLGNRFENGYLTLEEFKSKMINSW